MINAAFSFSLLLLVAFQIKGIYQHSECVQDFQKKSLALNTEGLLKNSSSTHPFLICQRPAYFSRGAHEMRSEFPTTKQKIVLQIHGRLER